MNRKSEEVFADLQVYYMKDSLWQLAFSPKLLDRGREYYRSGAVDEIFRNSEQDCLTALVFGSKVYNVNIWMDMQTGNVHHMECSCPYAQEHTHCKHMAAVLFALDAVGEENIPDTKASTESGAQPNSTDAELTGTPLTVQKEWRDFFTPTVLKSARK